MCPTPKAHSLADAGPVAQHVEVVYDAWLFVLASASEAVPARVARLASLAPADTASTTSGRADVRAGRARRRHSRERCAHGRGDQRR
jgi:hypothetical protein